MDVKNILQQIKEAEDKIIRFETQLELTKKTLKDKYEINSLEEADAYLDKASKELDEKEALLKVKKKELEEGYEWD